MNANNLDADVIPDVKSIAEFSYSSTEQQKTYIGYIRETTMI